MFEIEVCLEALQDISRGDVENTWSELLAVVEHLLHVHFNAEGADLLLLEERTLGSLDLKTSGDKLLVRGDFDLGLENICISSFY